MSVLALGLNHTTASLDLRGRVTFAPERLAASLQSLHGRLQRVDEVAIVSTCNRTELYLGADAALVHPAFEWLASEAGVGADTLRSHAYVLEGSDAVRHSFRVASGLDSMVLGEPQILGQMKQAVREADLAGTLGGDLDQMFQRTFAIAKEVRSSTEIGAHSISMAAAATRLAAQLFEDLRSTRVLFVGAGEMIELAATHFAARHPKAMVVANRTVERGDELAKKVGAEAIRLADLPGRLAEFDIVVSCTASALPIIGLGAVERALKARRRRPMFMLDLAVPRDIEPEVSRLDDVYLYTVDDLSTLVQAAGEKREAAVAQAEAIIEVGVQNFVQWLARRQTTPLIQALHAQTDDWRAIEIARARKALASGETIESVLEAMSRGLTQKMLHGMLTELRSADADGRERLTETLSRLFLRSGPRRNPDDRR